MNIKPLIQNISNFLFDRFVQLIGIVLTFLSIFVLLALFTYSAEDPNFVFSNNNEINNIFGFQGSIVSDFLLQTMGLVSFLFSITLFITGINVVIKKRLVIILENFFYTILYIIFGTVFLGIFYLNSFWLPVNGNGGFVGNILTQTFLENLILTNQKISYYILMLVTGLLFLKSINFSPMGLINFIKKTDLDDVSIETENYKIRVKKNSSSISEKVVHKSEKPKIIEKKKTVVEDTTTESITNEEKAGNNIIIKSPMIGTFYKSPNPESDPFVSEGDTIKPGQTICIIEAMKLFNEIESEVTGKVVKVLANDSSPVEFDQPLFEIDPS